ncbi:MAG: arsenate reductase [Flavobacteriaceae bacterium]|nr:arsenate reductase [Flavobacteriaceae bacterium]
MKYKLLHNPRCRKSREGLEFLKAKKIEFETILYLADQLNEKQIEEIIDKSELNPIDLIRKQEKVWKELFKNKLLSKNQIIQAIFEHPKLMQRPIFISENKAIIANPPEESLKIL